MQAYATAADLVEWLGLEDAPADSDRILLRASEIVEFYCLSGYAANAAGDPIDEDEKQWLRDAACAQVEFWGVVSEEHSIAGVTTGSMSANGVTHDMPDEIGPRVLQILDRAGMRRPFAQATRYRRPLDLIGRSY